MLPVPLHFPRTRSYCLDGHQVLARLASGTLIGAQKNT